jgi:6-phosphogluconolactonase
MKKFNLFIYLIALIMILTVSCKSKPVKMFTGTYAESGEKGLYLLDLNVDEGTLNLVTDVDAGPNPSYLCISPKHGMIYAANEVMEFQGITAGGVTALSYDLNSGTVQKVSELAVPNGGPAYISLSTQEDYLFLANYSGGSIAVVRLDDKGIPVGVTDTVVYDRTENKKSHAHMIAPDPSGKRIYVTDLGFDQVLIYELDHESGKFSLIPDGIAKLAEGAGPRHFTFSSDGTKMYVINELNSTISFFTVNNSGNLTLVQTVSTLAEGFQGKSYCADIHIGKSGEFLYGSNRGENTIVTFRIGADGKLTLAGTTPCGGEWPRNFVIDPSGKALLVGNQNTGNISFFGIDEKTGLPTGPAKDYKVKSPVCLKFTE